MVPVSAAAANADPTIHLIRRVSSARKSALVATVATSASTLVNRRSISRARSSAVIGTSVNLGPGFPSSGRCLAHHTAQQESLQKL